MATFPQRRKYLEDVVNTLLPQVQILRIYLNGYQEVPEFLQHPKVETFIGDDIGDAGKFFWLGCGHEVYFSVDDDFYYPPTYVRDHLQTLQFYRNRVIVTLHGCLLKFPVERYYRDRAEIYGWYESAPSKFVHVGGTGVMAFDTEAFPLQFIDVPSKNMADIWVALKAQKLQMPILVREHQADYLTLIDEPAGESIWNRQQDDPRPAYVINSVPEWKLHVEEHA